MGYVLVEHGETDRRTQIEGNTYRPRFLWKTKMPFYKTMGMRFVVNDANVLKEDEVMGRAFIDIGEIAEMMKTGEPGLFSLGENIGVLKVVVTPPPADLKERGGALTFYSTVKRLDAPEVAIPDWSGPSLRVKRDHEHEKQLDFSFRNPSSANAERANVGRNQTPNWCLYDDLISTNYF